MLIVCTFFPGHVWRRNRSSPHFQYPRQISKHGGASRSYLSVHETVKQRHHEPLQETRHTAVISLFIPPCTLDFIRHLKGAQAQLDVQSGCDAGALRQEGEHCVVHPEQRDQKKGGFRQPPVERAGQARLQIRTSEEHWHYKMNLLFFRKPDPNSEYCRNCHINTPENLLNRMSHPLPQRQDLFLAAVAIFARRSCSERHLN